MHDIKEVLMALKTDGLALSAVWRQAHELAQKREGIPAYDRLHALLHRIEGDQPNAAYWYRRCGEPAFVGDVADEVEHLIERLSLAADIDKDRAQSRRDVST